MKKTWKIIALSSAGIINICSAEVPLPPGVESNMSVTNNRAVLSFNTVSNRHYVIETSTDLRTWQVTSDSPVASDGSGVYWQFADDAAHHKFYRVAVFPWTVSNISNGYGDVGQSSIAIDINDVIHVAFNDTDSADLIYASSSNQGQSWDREVVSSMNNVGGYPTLKLSVDNTPYIVYTDKTQNRIMCSWKPISSSTWLHTTAADVDALFVSWTKPSFSISPDGTLGISYTDRDPYRLRMGISSVDNPTAWTNMTLIEDTVNLGPRALVFDSLNHPIISFSQDGKAVVARFDLSSLEQTNLYSSYSSYAFQISRSKTGRLVRCRPGSNTVLDLSDDGYVWTNRILNIEWPSSPSIAFSPDDEPSIACTVSADILFHYLNGSNSYETVKISDYGDFADHAYLADGRPVVIFRDTDNRLLCFIRDE